MIKKNSFKKLYTVLFYLGVFNFCTCCIQTCIVCFVASLSCVVCDCCWLAVCIVVVVLYMCFYLMCICCIFFFFTLDAGLLARSQYPEGPAAGHFDTGFSWFPYVYKQMLRWFPRFQVTNTCSSCSPPDLNLLVTNFMFCIHVK